MPADNKSKLMLNNVFKKLKSCLPLTREGGSRQADGRVRGLTLLEAMLALTILGAVIIPLVTHLPGVMKLVSDLYQKNRLIFVSQAISEHMSRWGNKRETDLDAFWVRNWATSALWHDFEARNLDELIGVDVHIPIKYRVNIESFDHNGTDKLGFVIIVYYDSDGSRSLTADDKNRYSFYILAAERG